MGWRGGAEERKVKEWTVAGCKGKEKRKEMKEGREGTVLGGGGKEEKQVETGLQAK